MICRNKWQWLHFKYLQNVKIKPCCLCILLINKTVYFCKWHPKASRFIIYSSIQVYLIVFHFVIRFLFVTMQDKSHSFIFLRYQSSFGAWSMDVCKISREVVRQKDSFVSSPSCHRPPASHKIFRESWSSWGWSHTARCRRLTLLLALCLLRLAKLILCQYLLPADVTQYRNIVVSNVLFRISKR